MKLSPAQTDDLKKHFIQKWKPDYSCNMCDHKNFTISDIVVELQDFHQRSGTMVINAGAPVIPVVAVFCDNCGHAEFVSPLAAGIKL